MLEHVAYWTGLAERGAAVVFGPVGGPNGGYGVGVVELEDDADIHEIEANDPTIKSGLGFKYEIAPMARAILRNALAKE